MLYLAFIFHMHQPYYKNLLTGEAPSPWVRLHATKDYSDMVLILEKFPKLRQTFNLVPSLIEQLEDYANGKVNDRFLNLSYKKTEELSNEDKEFLRQHFFKINLERVISVFPRYYQLFHKFLNNGQFSNHDYLDLAILFNLAWIDPYFRDKSPRLTALIKKARFFTEEDKIAVLDEQKKIIQGTLDVYKRFMASGQIEVTLTPYYHPILPLIYNTKAALEANYRTSIPKDLEFSYPEDAKEQVMSAVKFYEERFGAKPKGMWPSEEAVSEHILPFIIQSGIKWIVTDEGLLFKSIRKKRDGKLLYQPYRLEREEGNLNIVFRDRNMSDLIGFVYYRMKTKDAVNDFMHHLQNIAKIYKEEDGLLAIAMDGENAWEYYPNDGHDFLETLYQSLSDADFVKTTTVAEYINTHPPKKTIKKLRPGSWINSDFTKWIGNGYKNKAWKYLAEARKVMEEVKGALTPDKLSLAFKQMYILEGSDWFWWYGDQNSEFDSLFRMHLSNFYRIIEKDIPASLNYPLEP